MEEFVACRKCHHQESSSIPEGYYLEGDFLHECKHHVIWRINSENERKFINNGFNKSDFEKDWTSYVGHNSSGNIDRLKNYEKYFNEGKQGLVEKVNMYWYGENGTQKTTVANILGKDLISFGSNPKYILMKSLVDLLWESQRDEEAQKKIEDLSACNVLFIDEAFDKEKLMLWKSGAQIGCIDEFLRERINNNKGTIFISNKKPNEIEKQGFSHSIEDLIRRETEKRDYFFEFKDNYFDSTGEIPATLF